MQLFSFRISISNNWSSLVPDEAFRDFYKEVTFSIFSTEITTSNFSQLNIDVNPPLEPDWKILTSNLKECLNSIKVKGLESCVFLHIHEVVKPTYYHDVIAYFEQIKNELELNTKVIIFLNNEESILSVEPLLKDKVGLDKEIVFVNENGRYTYSNTENREIEEFEDLYRSIRLSLEDKLRLKLIRRVGHFVKEKNEYPFSCQKYFYDGSHCVSEITALLYEQIISKIDTSKTFGSYIPSICSNWATNSFLQIHEKLKKEYSPKYFGKKVITDEFQEVEQLILFSSVVVSGNTVREEYNEILSKNKELNILPFCIIDCLSNKQTDSIGGEVQIDNGNSSIVLNYLVQRNQKYHIAESEKCEMCNKNLDIPRKQFENIDIEPNLSSFEMWSMTSESGLSKEHTPPPDKEKNGRFPHDIPNTLGIVKFNGAYIASKFEELLRQNKIEFPKSGFLAYPDETNNSFGNYKHLTSDPVASNLFISSLRLIYDYNILPIPRIIIEEIKKDAKNLDSLKTDYADFYHHQLLRVKNEPIIIIDEFPRRYKTYEGMRKILKVIEKIPVAYITLFNFSPDLVSEKVTDTKHLNFYEFQLD